MLEQRRFYTRAMQKEKFIRSGINDCLCEDIKRIRWVFEYCQFEKRSISFKTVLGASDLLKRPLKNPVEKFIIGDSAAQYFTNIFNIFGVNN